MVVRNSAEISDLIGLYILCLINNKFHISNGGIYRDDSPEILKNINGQPTNKLT